MKAIAAAALMLSAITAQGLAQVTLWGDRPGVESSSLLRDVKGRDFKVHDIVSIVVAVSAQASTSQEQELERKSPTNNFAIDRYIRLRQEGLSLALEGREPENLAIDLRGARKYENEGSSDRRDLLRTRIAAEIVDIKPNGNLVIEARHQFTKQQETTVITLAGIVRPQDVMPDNVVYSYNVADADIRYESSGPVTDAARRGWLTKVFDKVWPF